VLLMGVSHLQEVISRLLAEGIVPETSAICIEWGTTPQQRLVEGTLATLPEKVRTAGLQAPALTVIGAVVDLRALGLAWFG